MSREGKIQLQGKGKRKVTMSREREVKLQGRQKKVNHVEL